MVLTKVMKCPNLSLIDPKKSARNSPLDVFYASLCTSLGIIYTRPFVPTLFDVKKIHLNEVDASILYSKFKEFTQSYNEGFGGHQAALQIWDEYGPSISKFLPKGWIGMEEGFLIIA